jgi:hypothetical protein
MKPIKNIVVYDQFWKYPYRYQNAFDSSLVNIDEESFIYKLGWRQEIQTEMLPWSLHQLQLPEVILKFLNYIQAKPDDNFLYMDVHCSFNENFKWEFPTDAVSLIQSKVGESTKFRSVIIAGTVKNVTSLYKNLKGRIYYKSSFEDPWLEPLINKGVPNTIKFNPLIEEDTIRYVDKFKSNEEKFQFDWIGSSF